MNLVRIPIQELEKVWGLVEKDIKSALAYSGQLTDSDFVYETALEGKYFGVVVTEIIKRKFGKVCHIYIATGRQRTKWQHLINDVEKFAEEEGCKMMELIARPGWQKVYNNYGYKRTHVVLEKQIKQENKE